MSLTQSHRSRGRRLICLFGMVGGLANLGPRSDAADDAADGRARCRLLIWNSPGEREARPLVFLDQPQEAKRAGLGAAARPEIGSSGLLLRELVRQAVLMAARDGCDARTRDALLNDLAGADKPSATLTVEWGLSKDAPPTVLLRAEAGAVL